MLLAYVDESYVDDWYYIAAAIGTEVQWEDAAARLAVVRSDTMWEHNILDPELELHAYELMSGSGLWKPLRGKHREAAGIYRAVLGAARDSGVRFILRGVDVARLNARYKYPEQPHTVVLGHLLERIDEHSRWFHQGAEVQVIADQIATQDDHIAQFGTYQTFGTPGYRPSRLTTIRPPIRFADSKAHAGLQVADFGAYLHRRRETVQERNPAGRKSVARLCAILDKMTAHNITWLP